MPDPTSKRPRIYLDYNATCPTEDGVVNAMVKAMAIPGNPSSPHAEGRSALASLESSRIQIAKAIGASSLDLVFTSGGTEANHVGLVGLARSAFHAKDRPKHKRIVMPPTVHPSLWAAGQHLQREGGLVSMLPVTSSGRVALDEARILIEELDDIAVLAFSLANHELGAIEDVQEMIALAASANALVFCDAVQALGRMPISVMDLGVDALSISAHKIGGPKGIGAVWLKPGVDVRPVIGGGKQEGGRRAGTQGVAMIAGFEAAIGQIDARLGDCERQSILRDQIASGLAGLGAEVLSQSNGLCNTVCARFPGIPGDVIVASLDLAGIAISTGAACSSGTTAPSPVLLGIGLKAAATLEAIRMSIGQSTTANDVQVLLEVLPAILDRARQFS